MGRTTGAHPAEPGAYPNGDAVIEVRDLRKSYGKVVALDASKLRSQIAVFAPLSVLRYRRAISE